MSDVQLERSVLEAKERDELFAIAVALGTSPAARTKKADLVSHILQVTGVEADAAPAVDKPRRPCARKPAAVPADIPVTDDGATQLELVTETSSNGHAPQAATERLDQAVPVPAGNANGNGHANGNGNTNGNGNGIGNQPGHAPATAERASAPAGDNQPGGDSASGSQRSDQGRQPRHDLDPGLGNSRRRRRRNREKTTRAPEREFTAQPAEVPYTGELVQVSGLLDLREEGYGFLRTNGYLASSTDVYVSITQVRRYGLRKGDLVDGSFRPAANNEKYPALVKVDSVAGLPGRRPQPAQVREPHALVPGRQVEPGDPGEPGNVTARIVDLVSPIGKGQRGLIVSPPRRARRPS